VTPTQYGPGLTQTEARRIAAKVGGIAQGARKGKQGWVTGGWAPHELWIVTTTGGTLLHDGLPHADGLLDAASMRELAEKGDVVSSYPDTRYINFTVSGKAYRRALDPLATGWESDGGPAPFQTLKRGAGFTYWYRLTKEHALDMYDRLDTCADIERQAMREITTADRLGYDEARRDYQACRKDADRLRTIIIEKGWLK
jgi:hypothetical protein